MPKSNTANPSLTGGLLLLAVSCINIGYGLCMLVNGMENAAIPLAVGAILASLSTIFLSRAAPPKIGASEDD